MAQEHKKYGECVPVDGAHAGGSGVGTRCHEPDAVLDAQIEKIGLVHILVIGKRGGIIIPKGVRERMDGCEEGKMLLVAEMVNGTTPMITLVPENRPSGKAKKGGPKRLTPQRR